MKTFQELIDNGEYTFPVYVDEATQELLVNRFSIRRCPKNFNRLFTFDLDVFYPQYLQMLRVDPQHIEIDWFVENYMRKSNSKDTVSIKDSTEQMGDTTVKNASYSKNKYGNGSDAHTGADVRTDNLEETTGYGSKVNTVVTKNSENEGASDANSRNIGFTRTNPMSASYTDEELNGIYYKGGKKDENGTKSSAQLMKACNGATLENGGKTYGIPYPKIKNPSTSADGLQMNADVRYEKSNSTNTDNLSREGTDIVSNTGTQTQSYGSVHTTGYNDYDGGSSNDATTKNINANRTSGEELHDAIEEEYRGRNTLPAEVLRGAVSFIQNTNAFKWLYKTLDRNFIQTYEREDYV